MSLLCLRPVSFVVRAELGPSIRSTTRRFSTDRPGDKALIVSDRFKEMAPLLAKLESGYGVRFGIQAIPNSPVEDMFSKYLAVNFSRVYNVQAFTVGQLLKYESVGDTNNLGLKNCFLKQEPPVFSLTYGISPNKQCWVRFIGVSGNLRQKSLGDFALLIAGFHSFSEGVTTNARYKQSFTLLGKTSFSKYPESLPELISRLSEKLNTKLESKMITQIPSTLIPEEMPTVFQIESRMEY